MLQSRTLAPNDISPPKALRQGPKQNLAVPTHSCTARIASFRKKNPVVLVTAIFGQEPSARLLLPFFLKTASRTGYDIIIFGDTSLGNDMMLANCLFIHLSWNEVAQRILEKVPECSASLALANFSALTHYKVIDLKPLYGVILEAELSKYQMWGHIDNDLLLGKLKRLTSKSISSFEVIPMQANHNAFGPLTFYCNTLRVNPSLLESSAPLRYAEQSYPMGV
eukprot:3941417-Rhodomonas_salina.2